MNLRLRSPWPWILAVSQTCLAYVLLRYSFVQERLHYVGRHEFDPTYAPWAKVLVVWMNAPVYVATFWTSFFWTNEAWEYSKLPGIFIFWLLIGCTFALPTRKRPTTRWWYAVAGVCLLVWAIWDIRDFVLTPFNWINRPGSYASGIAVLSSALPAWFLFGCAYCIIKFRNAD